MVGENKFWENNLRIFELSRDKEASLKRKTAVVSSKQLEGLLESKQAVVLLAECGKEIRGVLALKHMEWDTNFFNKKLAKIDYFKAVDSKVADGLVKKVLSIARGMQYQHLMCRLRGDFFNEIWALEENGFKLMDIGVSLVLKIDNLKNTEDERKIEIRPMREEDCITLKELSSRLFKLSHFYINPFFNDKEVNQLYEIWLENSYRGLADVVFVAEVKKKPVGFIACTIDRKTGIGSINLLGIDQEFSGRGIGISLVNRSLSWFSERTKEVHVRTQAINYPAFNLYLKSGFKANMTDVTYCRALT